MANFIEESHAKKPVTLLKISVQANDASDALFTEKSIISLRLKINEIKSSSSHKRFVCAHCLSSCLCSVKNTCENFHWYRHQPPTYWAIYYLHPTVNSFYTTSVAYAILISPLHISASPRALRVCVACLCYVWFMWMFHRNLIRESREPLLIQILCTFSDTNFLIFSTA